MLITLSSQVTPSHHDRPRRHSFMTQSPTIKTFRPLESYVQVKKVPYFPLKNPRAASSTLICSAPYASPNDNYKLTSPLKTTKQIMIPKQVRNRQFSVTQNDKDKEKERRVCRDTSHVHRKRSERKVV